MYLSRLQRSARKSYTGRHIPHKHHKTVLRGYTIQYNRPRPFYDLQPSILALILMTGYLILFQALTKSAPGTQCFRCKTCVPQKALALVLPFFQWYQIFLNSSIRQRRSHSAHALLRCDKFPVIIFSPAEPAPNTPLQNETHFNNTASGVGIARDSRGMNKKLKVQYKEVTHD